MTQQEYKEFLILGILTKGLHKLAKLQAMNTQELEQIFDKVLEG